MRVRYQMAGEAEVVLCDLSNREAKKKYLELQCNGECEWAELVGEDEDDYMEILESFDHIESAKRMHKILQEMRKCFG